MKTIRSTITSKGQATVPAEIRRKLGIGQRGHFLWVIDQDNIGVEPMEYTLESVFGSVLPSVKTNDIDQLITRAKDERATRLVSKLRSA